MAEISMITTPDGSSYDLKDAAARSGLAGKADSNDVVLTQAYGKVVSGYSCDPSTYAGPPYSGAVTLDVEPTTGGLLPCVDGNPFGDPVVPSKGQATITWTAGGTWGGTVDLVATLTWSDDLTDPRGYMLGDQSEKTLQPFGRYAAETHSHSAADITSGYFGVARGGTGQTSLDSGSYLVGNGTSAVSLKTPAQVLLDIGAAPSGAVSEKLNEDERYLHPVYDAGLSAPTLSRYVRTYRVSPAASSGTVTIPDPVSTGIPDYDAYYDFELEVAVDASCTTLAGPSGWTWLPGGDLPDASAAAGKTVYIACRLDCASGARTYLANVWRVA